MVTRLGPTARCLVYRDKSSEAWHTSAMPPAMLWLVAPSDLADADRSRVRQAVVGRLFVAAKRLLPRSDHLRSFGQVEAARAALRAAPVAAAVASALDAVGDDHVLSEWAYAASLLHRLWGTDGLIISAYRLAADAGHPAAREVVVTLSLQVATACATSMLDARRFPMPLPIEDAPSLIRQMLDEVAPDEIARRLEAAGEEDAR